MSSCTALGGSPAACVTQDILHLFLLALLAASVVPAAVMQAVPSDAGKRSAWVPKFRSNAKDPEHSAHNDHEQQLVQEQEQEAEDQPQPQPQPQQPNVAALEALGAGLEWSDADVDAVLQWCYTGDQCRVPNRSFGRGGRLPKLLNVLSNSCSFVAERVAEMRPKHNHNHKENENEEKKEEGGAGGYSVQELRVMIGPFARRVLLAIEEREGAASGKRPLEIWENEMEQEEVRAQKQKKVVDMRLPRFDPAIVTRDLRRPTGYMERLLEDKRTDIWTQLHEDFLVQWSLEHLSRIPAKQKQEGRLERFLRTVTNSCVEINELLDNAPEIWEVEQEICKREQSYMLHTDSLTGTKQKLNADGTVHLRIAVVREQFVVHLAKRVLDIVDKKTEEDNESDSGFDDDDDDDDSDDSFL